MANQFWNLRTVLTIFILVIGHTPSPVQPDPISLSAIIAAAGSAITAGSSLAGTTLNGIASTNYGVTCTIQVENWTRFSLLYPYARLKGGAVTTTPVAILPGKKEAFAVRKPSNTATGTYGTVSWQVMGAKRRFVVMWSAPYDFNYHSNWLGAGMTRFSVTSVAKGNKWFDQMYYEPNNYDLQFDRKEYFDTTDPVIYRDDDFEIVGQMNNIHHAQIKIIFRPVLSKWKTDLAESIKALL